MGIYTSVCDKEIKCKRNYKSFSRVINIALGMQLVVAAALTALGAANGSRSAVRDSHRLMIQVLTALQVTVFGAINTIIAGFLTYLKGSGLPNRVKYFQHEWTKLREYIEQRERDFSFRVLTKEHVQSEVEQIRTMYEHVRTDIETNTPDRFVGINNRTMAPPLASSVTRPANIANVDGLGKKFASDLDDKQAQANAAMNQAQHSASDFFGKAQGIKERLEDKIHDLGQMEKEIESDGRNMVREKKQGIAAQIEHAMKEIAHLGEELESKAKGAVPDRVHEIQQGARATYGNAQNAVHDATDAARAATLQQQEQAQGYLQNARDTAHATLSAARTGVAQQRDQACGELQNTQSAVQRAAEASRATFAQQQQQAQNAIQDTSDAGRVTIAQQQAEAQRTIQQASEAARDAVNQHREAAAAAIAPHERDHGL